MHNPPVKLPTRNWSSSSVRNLYIYIFLIIFILAILAGIETRCCFVVLEMLYVINIAPTKCVLSFWWLGVGKMDQGDWWWPLDVPCTFWVWLLNFKEFHKWAAPRFCKEHDGPSPSPLCDLGAPNGWAWPHLWQLCCAVVVLSHG